MTLLLLLVLNIYHCKIGVLISPSGSANGFVWVEAMIPAKVKF